MRRNSFNTSSNPAREIGIFKGSVVSVGEDGLLRLKIPKLGLNNIYEGIPYAGPMPAAGDVVFVGFLEGKSGSFVAFTGVVGAGNTGDPAGDITSVVAGTNLNGGGSSGTVTVNLESDITLTSVTADAFYGDLYGAIHILVKNVSGGSLTKGTPVYATGAVGASGAVEVEASLAGTGSTMPAMGLLDQDLDHNGQGDVVVSGVLQNFDTDTPGYSVGDALYVAVSGGLTTTRPTGSSELVQKIGKVIRVQQNTGEILVQGAGRTNDIPNSFTTSGDVTVGGDLTVNGTTVTLNTETLTVEDNIILLNSNVTGTPSLNAGIEIERGSETNVSFLWDESADAWSIGAVNATGTVTAAALAVTGEFTLPTADGTADQVLVTDGSGSVTWQDSGETTPGGSDGLVQYNNGGAFGGASSLYYDDVNNRVGINDSTPSYTLDVNGTGRFTGALDADTQINLGSALHLTEVDVDGSMRVQGNTGYIDIGPKSASYCNIDTDLGSFYFNKSTLYAAGNIIWHAGNDGSGSGLDADTVDGVHASSFLRSDTTDSASGTLSFSTASATNFTSTNLTVGASLNTGRRFYVYGGTLASELRRESTSSSSGIAVFTGTGGVSKFIFYADGTGGKATGDAAWVVVSDDRLKNKLTSLDRDDTLTRLMALDPTMYEHTHTINLVSDGIGEDDLEVVDLDVPASPLAGFMASDFETQFPDLVMTKGTQNIRHLPIGQWDAILTAGLQASVRRIEALEERIAALEAQ